MNRLICTFLFTIVNIFIYSCHKTTTTNDNNNCSEKDNNNCIYEIYFDKQFLKNTGAIVKNKEIENCYLDIKNGKNDGIEHIENLLTQQPCEHLDQHMHQAAAIGHEIMLHLGTEHIHQAIDWAGIVNRAIHEHVFIDKIIVKLCRQQVKYIKRHCGQHNDGQSAIGPTPLFIIDKCHSKSS